VRWSTYEIADLARVRVVSLDRVAVLGDRIVALGQRQPDGTALFTSDDGATWQSVEGIPAALVVETVQTVGGRFWVVAHRGPVPGRDRQVWTSANGLDWRRTAGVTGLDFGPGRVSRIVRVGDVRLATAVKEDTELGGAPSLFRSTDGRAWEEVSLPQGSYIVDGITVSDNRFVAVKPELVQGAPGPGVVHSADGLTWDASPVTEMPVDLSGVAWGEHGYIAFGSAQKGADRIPVAFLSDDAVSWEPAVFVPEPTGGAAAMTSVVAFRDGFIGTGFVRDELLAVWASSDGRTWFAVPGFPAEPDWIYGMAASGDRIVLTGQTSGDPVVPQVWLGEAVPPSP
jgi:hypothetical protein